MRNVVLSSILWLRPVWRRLSATGPLPAAEPVWSSSAAEPGISVSETLIRIELRDTVETDCCLEFFSPPPHHQQHHHQPPPHHPPPQQQYPPPQQHQYGGYPGQQYQRQQQYNQPNYGYGQPQQTPSPSYNGGYNVCFVPCWEWSFIDANPVSSDRPRRDQVMVLHRAHHLLIKPTTNHMEDTDKVEKA